MARHAVPQKYDTMILRWYRSLGPKKTAIKLGLTRSYVRSRWRTMTGKVRLYDAMRAEKRRNARQAHDA